MRPMPIFRWLIAVARTAKSRVTVFRDDFEFVSGLSDAGQDGCANDFTAAMIKLPFPVVGFPGQEGDSCRGTLARLGTLSKIGACESCFPVPALKLACAAALVLCASAADAQYTFTNIVDTTTAAPGAGTFNGFMHAGVRGDTASFVAGYNNGTLGVFTSTGGVRTAIANTDSGQAPGGGTFTAFNTPVIISGNNTAFLGLYVGSVGNGIFTGSGGALTTIVRNGTGALAQVPGGGTFTSFSQPPAVSGNAIVFNGSYSGGMGNRGIFSATGGTLTTIVKSGDGAPEQTPGGGTFQNIGAPTISGNTVAFNGDYIFGTGGTFGVFTGSGGALTSIATGGNGASAQVPGGGTFTGLGEPSISGNTVAFVASYSGGTGSRGIFSATGGTLTAVAISGVTPVPGGGTFGFVQDPVVSGSTIAFQAAYSGGGAGTAGIFASNSGTLVAVIRQGDPLFGSTVTNLAFGPSGFDGTRVAFVYSLANFRSGVAVATLDTLFADGFDN